MLDAPVPSRLRRMLLALALTAACDAGLVALALRWLSLAGR